MKSISDEKGTQNILFEVKPSKHKFEYQELCEELAKIYGKQIWILPSKPFFTEHKLRKAHEVCQKRGVLTFNYLYGVLRKL